MLVASQFEVFELIPATFEVPRGILDALEQFLSLKGPQNAIVGGLWIFTKKSRILRNRALELMLPIDLQLSHFEAL